MNLWQDHSTACNLLKAFQILRALRTLLKRLPLHFFLLIIMCLVPNKTLYILK